jgi:hypothetical protein
MGACMLQQFAEDGARKGWTLPASRSSHAAAVDCGELGWGFVTGSTAIEMYASNALW